MRGEIYKGEDFEYKVNSLLNALISGDQFAAVMCYNALLPWMDHDSIMEIVHNALEAE